MSRVLQLYWGRVQFQEYIKKKTIEMKEQTEQHILPVTWTVKRFW
jgi:hypothetical protein